MAEKSFFECFSVLISPQSLHLSVHQPELMDLSADRQTAHCQLCSVQPDNSNSSLSPKMDGLTTDLDAENSACLFCPHGYFILFIYFVFGMFQSLCLFPLLTSEINRLI